MKQPRACRAVGRAGLLIALSVVASCGRESVEQIETNASVPVEVERATVEDVQELVSVAGVVLAAPGAELTVTAPDAARIAELPKAEGESVAAGDLLVRFDIPSLASDLSARRAAVSQAAARVAATSANLARLSSLLTQGVAAPRDVEDARRQQAEAEADVEQARTAVEAAAALSSRADVVAPFPGVIAKRFHNPGDLVEAAASDPILRLINPARLQIVASVPVAQLPKIVPGHTVYVHVPGRDDAVEARVLTRAAEIDPATSTGNVRVAFVQPAAVAVGTHVRVDIVGAARTRVVTVPLAAIVEDEGDIFVMVAGGDGKAHKYPVALGLASATRTEVTSGLKPGDRVILRGQAELPEGAAITVDAK